ncbi:MAG: hypothetical protein HY868_25460 [Chloroflexi bacterium]|nr:hypothetical protein [Chloroflexota bacterium]
MARVKTSLKTKPASPSPATVPVTKDELYARVGASPFFKGEAESASRIIASLGGVRDALDGKASPQNAIEALATAMDETYAAMTSASQEAQPPPSEWLAGFRFVDYLYKTNGDIAQTIDIPTDMLCKQVHYSCDDDGAQHAWQELWGGVDAPGLLGIDITALFEEFFYENETYFNTFPLEIWNGDTPVGIAMLEPHSMWVGRSVTNNFGYSLMMPGKFEEAKFKDMVHPLAYSSFVVDQNVQTGRYTRVPIAPESMRPIYGRKFAFQRYATPLLMKCGRNALNRLMNEELRRGTTEGFLNQILLITVGAKEDSPQVIKSKINQMNSKMAAQKNERTGLLVSDYTTKGEILAPKSVEELMGTATWAEITQAIFRDLGFSVFFLTGELPGTNPRGGAQMEINVQFAIERWKHKQRKILEWFAYFSRKFALRQKSHALLKYLPKFSMDQIGIEQTQAIKERIVPMYMAGLLDPQQALAGAGYNYSLVVKNKREAAANAELFEPPTIYKQEAINSNGDSKETAFSPRGRQPDAQNLDRINAARNPVKDSARDWTDEINTQFDAMVVSGDRVAFANWMKAQLRERLDQAYADGVQRGGGSEIDAQWRDATPYGANFHLGRMDGFAPALIAAASEDLEYLRYRALLYSSASRTLYLLGYQQAMKGQGAKSWQRVTHSELSESGPCPKCIADSAQIHPIDEPYFELHAHSICSAQTVDFHFGARPRASAPLPDYGAMTVHRLRRFPTAQG